MTTSDARKGREDDAGKDARDEETSLGRWSTEAADRATGGGGGGQAASLAAVVFRGMLGGRFPRGLCYRLGRMTSPRYQILNLLAPAAYPRQDIQTVLPRTPRPTGYPNRPSAYTASPHRLPTPKPTPSATLSLSLSLSLSVSLSACRRAYVVCSCNVGNSRRARDSPLRGHLGQRGNPLKFFSGNVKEMQREERTKERGEGRLRSFATSSREDCALQPRPKDRCRGIDSVSRATFLGIPQSARRNDRFAGRNYVLLSRY